MCEESGSKRVYSMTTERGVGLVESVFTFGVD